MEEDPPTEPDSRCKKAKASFKRVWNWQPSQTTRRKWWWVMIKKTKIPGVKEAVQNEAHICERFFWIMAVVSTFTVGILMMLHTNKQFKDMPIELIFKTMRMEIGNIPFGGLTVGKRNNLKDEFVEKIDGIQDVLREAEIEGKELVFNGEKWTAEQIKKTVVLAKEFCSPYTRNANWYPTEDPPRLPDTVVIKGLDLNEFTLNENMDDKPLEGKFLPLMKEATPNCSDMFDACTWNSNKVDCSELFRDVYTESGGACRFNGIPSDLSRKHETLVTMLDKMHHNMSKAEIDAWKAWDVDKNENGMYQETNITIGGRNITIPDSQKKEGQWFGLNFILKYPKPGKFCRQSDTEEYKMTVDFSLNESNLKSQGNLIPPNHNVINHIKPTIIIADNETRAIPAHKRGCYFTNEKEKELEYFTKYTEQNCWKECLVKEIEKLCNCTNLFYPRNPKNGTRICITIEDSICIKATKTNFHTTEASKNCDCLPSCNGVSYEMVTSMSPYSKGEVPDVVRDFSSDEIPTSVVTTSMDEPSVIVIRIKEQNDFIERVGIFGGIMGLTNNLTLMDFAKIFVALLGIIVPLKTLLDAITFLVQRAIRRSRGQEDAQLWLELFRIPLTITQSRGDLDDLDPALVSQMPPIIQQFLAEYAPNRDQDVVEAFDENEGEDKSPNGSLGNISAFKITRPATSTSRGLSGKSRKIRPMSSGEPLPTIPTWGDFMMWYRDRHGIRENAQIEPLPLAEKDEESHHQSCCGDMKLRFHELFGQGAEKEETPVVEIQAASTTAVIEIEQENPTGQITFFAKLKGKFRSRSENEVTTTPTIPMVPISLDDEMNAIDLQWTRRRNPPEGQEIEGEVRVVVTPPDEHASEDIF